MEIRLDFALIRHLSRTHSPALGTEYSRLPLFLIPEELSVHVRHERDLLTTIWEEGLHLPTIRQMLKLRQLVRH